MLLLFFLFFKVLRFVIKIVLDDFISFFWIIAWNLFLLSIIFFLPCWLFYLFILIITSENILLFSSFLFGLTSSLSFYLFKVYFLLFFLIFLVNIHLILLNFGSIIHFISPIYFLLTWTFLDLLLGSHVCSSIHLIFIIVEDIFLFFLLLLN